jgi:hypothetical protein
MGAAEELSMAKYGAEAQEKAYELMMIRQLPFMDVVRQMREEYPTFAKGTLTKWKNDVRLDWAGRYERHRRAIAEKSDAERVKQIKPVLHTIQDIRESVYNQLVEFLKGKRVITDKNVGLVLSSFVKLSDLEYKMTGGRRTSTPVNQVVQILIMVLEKNKNVGPVIKAHRNEIIEAVFEEISG